MEGFVEASWMNMVRIDQDCLRSYDKDAMMEDFVASQLCEGISPSDIMKSLTKALQGEDDEDLSNLMVAKVDALIRILSKQAAEMPKRSRDMIVWRSTMVGDAVTELSFLKRDAKAALESAPMLAIVNLAALTTFMLGTMCESGKENELLEGYIETLRNMAAEF